MLKKLAQKAVNKAANVAAPVGVRPPPAIGIPTRPALGSARAKIAMARSQNTAPPLMKKRRM